jgi:hypothetical protein
VRPFLVLVSLAAVLATNAAAAVQLGVYGNHQSFDRLTGQRTQSEAIFIGWDQGRTWGKPYSFFLDSLGERPHIALKTERARGGRGLSPRAIALGAGDAHLIGLAQAIAVAGKPVIMRPFPEMNNYDNDYAAFNSNGRRRDASRSTVWFKRAFKRVYILMHGGSATFMSAKLRAAKMPGGVRVDLPPNPYPNMTVVWNPLAVGEPPVAGNGFRDYFPGLAFVDAYGNNYYNTSGSYAFHRTLDLYRAYPRKPFFFPEWGLTIDDPGYIRAFATFVRQHRRVRFASFYNGSPGSVYDLRRKPRSLAAYRRYIVPLGR